MKRPLDPKPPRVDPVIAERLPPGQHPTTRWPVLHQGSPPAFDPLTWDLRVTGLVDRPLRYTWEEFAELPRATVHGGLHCVSRWSKIDNVWQGVPMRSLLSNVRPAAAARFVMVECDGGYSTNLPLAALEDDDVLLALRHDGEDLSPEHGYPVRLIIPRRYAWKSAKWVRSLEFLAVDRPGYWERYGYHENGDPWREQRFAEDAG